MPGIRCLARWRRGRRGSRVGLRRRTRGRLRGSTPCRRRWVPSRIRSNSSAPTGSRQFDIKLVEPLTHSRVCSRLQLKRKNGVAAALLYLDVFEAATSQSASRGRSARFGNHNVVTISASVGRVIVKRPVGPDRYPRAIGSVRRAKRCNLFLLRLLRLRISVRVNLLLSWSAGRRAPSSQLRVRIEIRCEDENQQDEYNRRGKLLFLLRVRKGHHVHHVFSDLRAIHTLRIMLRPGRLVQTFEEERCLGDGSAPASVLKPEFPTGIHDPCLDWLCLIELVNDFEQSRTDFLRQSVSHGEVP